jgi:hypothetical protein
MRVIAAVVLGMMSAAEAQAPKLEDQLIGVWKCESAGSKSASQGTMTFSADGTEIAEMTMLFHEPLNLEVFVRTTATWTLKDDQLTEAITTFKYTGGKKDGRPTAPGFLETILGEPPLPEAPLVSTIRIDGDVMRQKMSDGKVGPRCTRQK